MSLEYELGRLRDLYRGHPNLRLLEGARALVERLRGRPVRCVAAAEQHSLATTVPPPLPPTPPCRRATARRCGPMPARATTTTR